MAYDPELERAIEESKILYEEKEKYKQLCGDIPAPFPFKKIGVKADGNCLFHAIGKKVKKSASVVRQEICDYYDTFSKKLSLTKTEIKLIKNILPEYVEYLDAIDDKNKEIGKEIKEYSKNMRKDSVYGGIPEIMIASIIYEKTIFVFYQNRNVYRHEVFINNEKSPIYLFLCNSNGNEESEANHYVLLEINDPYKDNEVYNMYLRVSFKSKNLKKSKTKKSNSKSKKSNSKKSKTKSKI